MEVEEYEAGKMTKGEADAGKGDQAGQSQLLETRASPETQDSTEREEPEEETKPVTAIFNRVWSKQHPPSVAACTALAEEARQRMLDLGITQPAEKVMVSLHFGSATQGPNKWLTHASVQLENQPIVVATELLEVGGRMIVQGLTGFTTNVGAFVAFLEALANNTPVVFVFQDDTAVNFEAYELIKAGH